MNQKSGSGFGHLAWGILTLIVGALGGLSFTFFGLPLPWMLGSMAATALCVQAPLLQLSQPKRWRGYAIVVIGIMLGAGFQPDVIASAGAWVPSLLVMALISTLFFIFAYLVMHRWGNMNRVTAILAAVPGGFSVVSVLADRYSADTRRVALCHSARLIALLVLAPVMIRWVSDVDLAAATLQIFSAAEAFDPLQHGILALVAIMSWFIGQRSRVPSALLLTPLLLSATLHLTGIVNVHVPISMSVVAQIIIGTSIGVRFSQYQPRQILHDGWLAMVIGALLAFGALIAALLVARLTGSPSAALLLAYLPGGAPELGMVALALGIDPAMVATHHVLRVFMIVVALPSLIRLSSMATEHKSE
ncbi:AbrB family transcriptional regulator [Marinobacter sp.]|uniref:AbrB family transcriptional regulator n=1 Tax=Marinobacter sp. TaxID=50741 RepID=UPI001B44214E|nr:AbrB family transcriptional regulator [Marinobacter sp.]MBQ0833123.1 AbrB family transcriptional regulator [Marinobacter sp.]